MKTKQFIKEIKSMGLHIKDLVKTVIIDDDEYFVAGVSKEEFGAFATDYPGFYRLDYDTKLQLLNLLIKYAKTPIEDREDEEKYYYYLKGFGEEGYLNFEDDGTYLYVSDIVQTDECQTQFTDKEFAALPDDIKSHNWEKIKVEREEE